MKKFINLVSIVCVMFLLLNILTPHLAAKAEPINELNIQAKSAVLMESNTGKLLYEHNSHEKLPPASITKIMTMLLTMEAIENKALSFEEMVTCSENAAGMGGTQIWLEPGEQMSVHDLLKAIAVNSANDASLAIAEHIGGSEEAFVKAMNEKAKEIGMNDTNFINPHGLDAENHLTSAYDIAIMSKELLKHPKIFEYTTIWIDSLRDGETGLTNTNRLVRFYTGANGLKTGSTSKALNCLSATAKREEMQLISVIMASPTSKDRFNSATKLLDYGFANYTVIGANKKDDVIGEIKVLKGMQEKVELVTDDDFNLLVEKSKREKVDKKVTISEEVSAPVDKGQKVGEITYTLEGEEIGKINVITIDEVKKMSIGKMFTKLILSWLK